MVTEQFLIQSELFLIGIFNLFMSVVTYLYLLIYPMLVLIPPCFFYCFFTTSATIQLEYIFYFHLKPQCQIYL